MVTSNERTRSGSSAGALGLLFSAAVMLFVLLFGGTALGQEIDDQDSTTTNTGAGVANTGVNGAGGNASDNTASGDQTATANGGGDDSVASSSGNAGNSSGGNASINTGDANATGNASTNTTNQTVVSGHNGAVVLVDQEATVTNTGVGVANTGVNGAIGNASTNVSTADQDASATGTDEGVATNNATVNNNSGGDARVTTGDATATGSVSTNNINQTFDGDYSGGLGVVVIVDQTVNLTNTGIGVANTGFNAAVGNASDNTAGVDQGADATGSVAVNNATASTNSDGSARVMTGDATAVGNVANNNVSQIANVTAHGSLGSIVLIDQEANVANTGVSLANTGLNLAVGNLSDSTSNAVQGAVSGAGPPDADSVAANDGIASTNSNGTAEIHSGNANALGNSSNTNLTQAVDVNTPGNGIVLTDQIADVTNTGIGIANTGGNIAVGNVSTSESTVDQDAESTTAVADDAVAANFGTASTNSNGSGTVHSGNANATGNVATTNLLQTADVTSDGGVFLPDQEATVTNTGIGIANTGLNAAVGNASSSTATTTQDADVVDAAESAVASNFGEASTNSDGHAAVHTGNANATGNESGATTNIAQIVDANGSDVILSDQEATVTDTGIGLANTGLNAAIGNVSQTNSAATTQTATAGEGGDDSVASNFGSSLANSDGSAEIHTGSATAVGSSSRTNIAQTVDASDGGLLLSDQEATTTNTGIGIANTGFNIAVGNLSPSNEAIVNQTATTDAVAAATGDNVAANFGTSSTTSNGSATIRTGNALGIGSRSTTNIAQTVDFAGENFALTDQVVTATSTGIGLANTGFNLAIGNLSQGNVAVVDQTALVDADPGDTIGGDIVAANDGQANTSSDGTADITTGNADAIGNDSDHTLNVAQTADINGGGFALIDQEVTSTNTGIGIANTGFNAAIGNLSVSNFAGSFQNATVAEAGAGSITADDVVASNNAITNSSSNGSASIRTGAATAIGSTATTNVAQTADFNSEDGGFALVDQTAEQTNTGIGIANTGFNAAVGNLSQSNTGVVDQTAAVTETGAGSFTADDVVAANTATTNIFSDGDASIETGAATAMGNASRSTFIQTTDVNTDNGFALVDQEATELNTGIGIANSGVNLAVGNLSPVNTAGANQTATVAEADAGDLTVEDVAAVNTATTNLSTNGDAEIRTGAADATGNISSTTIAQTADANFNGNGFVLYDQVAGVGNGGVGLANSGVNAAIGNASTTEVAPASQTATVAQGGAGNLTADDVVAVNTSASNVNSNGSARIATGDAYAIGNDSGATTTINQVANANIGGNGFVLADQEATVVNVGIGIANTGVNAAVGNVSTTTLGPAAQTATVEAPAGNLTAEDVAAVNTATTNVNSDGSAEIRTGVAEGVGNRSTTHVNQVNDANISGNGFVLADQSGAVANVGVGVANSGINLAVGNASTTTACDVNTPCTQDATIDAGGDVVIEDGVAVNTLSYGQNSNGSATIHTGDSFATGNESTTTKNQIIDANIDGNGFVLADQVDPVLNIGIAVANSGINLAVGNASTNTAALDQDAAVTAAGTLTGDDVVASNTATTSNVSDGTARITTGCADAHGNVSSTAVDQVLNADIQGTGFVLSDQEADVTNLGVGVANTGINLAVGNISTNDIASDQDALIDAPATLTDDAVAANTTVGNNISNGTADIDTGDACALGNLSATGIAQTANYDDGGLLLADQTETITNVGVAIANSGVNAAAGNLSTNTTTSVSAATAPGGVAVNSAELNNVSDGTSSIATGDADATGNIAANASCQGINAPANCPVPPLPPVPPCKCHRPTSQPPVPPVPPTPPTPGAPGPGQPGVPGGVSTTPGAVLARTGLNVGVQAMLGLLLLAIGALLRRRARTA